MHIYMYVYKYTTQNDLDFWSKLNFFKRFFNKMKKLTTILRKFKK